MSERLGNTHVETDTPESFGVEIVDVSRLYRYAKGRAEKGAKSRAQVFASHTWLNSGVVKYDMSYLMGFNFNGLVFQVSNIVALSETRTSQSDVGYYSTQRIMKIQELLDGMGLQSRLDSERNKNWLQVMKDGVQVCVNFGYENQVTELDEIKISAERERKERGKVSDTTKGRMEEAKKGHSNLYLDLWKIHGRDQTIVNDIWVHLETPGKFAQNMETYREIYEKFLIALHLEDGKQPPTVKIRFRNNGLAPEKLAKSA